MALAHSDLGSTPDSNKSQIFFVTQPLNNTFHLSFNMTPSLFRSHSSDALWGYLSTYTRLEPLPIQLQSYFTDT